MRQDHGPKESIESALILYCDLMEEIKRRHSVIEATAGGKMAPFLPPRAAEELCYLQLRMICELIALASLVVHGDIQATRTGKITRRYQADWIMKKLADIHPNFYPRPSRLMADTYVEPITSGYLTRVDLATLYQECGNILHRGSVKSVLSREPRPANFKRIASWL